MIMKASSGGYVGGVDMSVVVVEEWNCMDEKVLVYETREKSAV